MSLPTREHFDLDGAAEFLGCRPSDVLYYVKEDQRRLAFKSEHADLIVFNQSLPKKAQKALNWFEGAYPQVSLTAKQSSKIDTYVNDWVYFQWLDYARSYDVDGGQALWQLQDFGGKLSPEEIAAVITFTLNSWGNSSNSPKTILVTKQDVLSYLK